jgi:hypothetical protein
MCLSEARNDFNGDVEGKPEDGVDDSHLNMEDIRFHKNYTSLGMCFRAPLKPLRTASGGL